MSRARIAAAIAAAAVVVGIAVIAGVRSSGARAPLVSIAPPESLWVEHADTLHPGEALGALLSRVGVSGAMALRVLDAAAPAVDERRVPPGLPVVTRRHASDAAPREVVFELAIDRFMRVRRTGDTTWIGEEVRLPWRVDTLVVNATIRANLYQALDDGAPTQFPKEARTELAWSLADVYEYRVDMSRELQKGDALRALVVRETGPRGAVRVGPILAARFTLSGSAMEAVRYTSASGRVEYFDATGHSLRAAFLRAPLEFRRVSSSYGTRFHPILRIWRQHAGVDYAAAPGTPVRAIGDGVVTFAGPRGGYGNLLEVRHRNGFISRYGHLRGFASGVRAGRPVTTGQTVAYVGSTGLATGPHLHFELLVGGAQRDPRRALAHSETTEIAAIERAPFAAARSGALGRMDGVAVPAPAGAGTAAAPR